MTYRVVDGDVALEGDRHHEEDGAGQCDPIERVEELQRVFRLRLTFSNTFYQKFCITWVI